MTETPTEAAWTARALRSAEIRRTERGAVRDLSLLPPHASLRRYARARFDDASEIVMLMPPAGSAPDEAGSSERGALMHDPFVLVQAWLHGLGLPVPELYAIDEEVDALWLEDLGGTDLDAFVSARPAELEATYRAALDLLIRFQSAALSGPRPAAVDSRVFGRDLLRWELEHYVEWRVEAWLGRSVSATQRAALDREFDRLADYLASVPAAPMHRDFQSHNLMVRASDQSLVMLDFQDAMTGPLIYDAVALLRDSYVRIPKEVLRRLVAHYAGLVASAAALPSDDQQAIVRWFHVQTLQRKLKDAARFVFIDRVKGNPSFLGYIDESIAYVREAFGELGDEWATLAELLSEIDPKAVP